MYTEGLERIILLLFLSMGRPAEYENEIVEEFRNRVNNDLKIELESCNEIFEMC